MMGLLPRIIAYNLYKRFGFPKILPVILTLSVNDWCNARCKTCNIWKNDPKKKIKEQLTLEEYERIFSNYGRTYWITITGGEPSLRNDLADIVKVVYYNTRPKLMTITTNGMKTETIVESVKEILGYCSKLKLIVNLSIDGVGKQHDKIRGVKGSFDLVLMTFKELKKIRNPRLTLGINTVISKYNVNSFKKIYAYVERDLAPDSYVVEIAENRAKLCNLELEVTPSVEEYKNVLFFLIKQLRKQRRSGISDIIRRIRLRYYESLLLNKFPPSFEGIASAYVMADGEVRISDTRQYIIGNLRDVDYNLRKLWFCKRAKVMRKLMNKSYRTMVANAFYTNFICDLGSL